MNSQKNIGYLAIWIVTIVLYGNTLMNQYALDDAIVITENNFTKQGIKGIDDILTNDTFTGFFGKKKDLVAGGRYRPLSMITFAIEYELFGLNPFISHLFNLILYALIGIFIFKTFSRLFDQKNNSKWYFSLPLLIAVLYIAHPVHTEAVANIKGRDEIMSMLGAVLTLYFSIIAVNDKKPVYFLYSGIAFFLALMSKENAITFLAVVPLALYIFNDVKLNKLLQAIIPLIISFVVFFMIRQAVVGQLITEPPQELMNNPFKGTTTAEKFATIFYTLGIYIKLLLYPHPLTFDYYPYHIPIMHWGSWKVVLPAIGYIIGFGYLFIYFFSHLFKLSGLSKQSISKGGIIAFAILFYLITLSIVSNIPFTIGAFMNERFIFMPSLAFCIILGYFLLIKLPGLLNQQLFKPVYFGLIIVLLSLYGIKTITRNTNWKNDFTLFTHDVTISTESAKSNCSAGGKLMEKAKKMEDKEKKKAYLERSIKHLKKAISIHPTYKDALLLLGNAYYEYNKNFEKTFYYYKQILKRNPHYGLVYDNAQKILAGVDSIDLKIKLYEMLFKYNPGRFEINYQLGNLYGKGKGNIKKAKYYLERAVKIKPKSKKALKDLGVAYGMSGDFKKSLQVMQKAIKLDPNDPQLYINMGISLKNIGAHQQAQKAFSKANQLKNNNK
jgi:tetratricopeptide (TPR) repeat protein